MSKFFGIFVYNLKIKNMGKKLTKNEDYFNVIDSELKAYLLGYFLADGCITNPTKGNKCISMCLQEKDRYILEWFLSEIVPECKICEYTKPSTGKTQHSFKFTAPIMANNLEKIYGIKSRKTEDIEYKFPFEKIETKYHHHFIRGYFDGDGWITERIVNDSHNWVPQFGFVATSLNFILQLKEIIPEFSIPRITTNTGKNMKYYQLIYSCKEGVIPIIKKWLYHDSEYYLVRKFEKFI